VNEVTKADGSGRGDFESNQDYRRNPIPDGLVNFSVRPDPSCSALLDSTSKFRDFLPIYDPPYCDSGFPGLSHRSRKIIYDIILLPLLAMQYLKDFHGVVKDCTRRVHTKEIMCLRDLERILLSETLVSIVFSNCI
jgi:hypothetical protein